MNRFSTLFFGILAAFSLSWIGLVLVPAYQIGNLKPVEDAATGDLNPPAFSGLSQRGSVVYAANGCAQCHTQMVYSANNGADIDRQWGSRQTVARDFLYEKHPQLGVMRFGPDLASVGKRYSTAESLHTLLYAPSMKNSLSKMPAHSFLYETRRIRGEASLEALNLLPPYMPALGFEVVPTDDAKALVAYLLSLNRSYGLPEAPVK
jgi:cytochrome c oxidase cbb3-type subunit 2